MVYIIQYTYIYIYIYAPVKSGPKACWAFHLKMKCNVLKRTGTEICHSKVTF